jgi:hypothetical protein
MVEEASPTLFKIEKLLDIEEFFAGVIKMTKIKFKNIQGKDPGKDAEIENSIVKNSIVELLKQIKCSVGDDILADALNLSHNPEPAAESGQPDESFFTFIRSDVGRMNTSMSKITTQVTKMMDKIKKLSFSTEGQFQDVKAQAQAME